MSCLIFLTHVKSVKKSMIMRNDATLSATCWYIIGLSRDSLTHFLLISFSLDCLSCRLSACFLLVCCFKLQTPSDTGTFLCFMVLLFSLSTQQLDSPCLLLYFVILHPCIIFPFSTTGLSLCVCFCGPLFASSEN